MLIPTSLAYIDPMSGSILIQLIVAGLLGTAVFFRRWIGRAFRRVLRLNAKRSDEESS